MNGKHLFIMTVLVVVVAFVAYTLIALAPDLGVALTMVWSG